MLSHQRAERLGLVQCVYITLEIGMGAFFDFMDGENVESVCAGTFEHSLFRGGGIFGPSPETTGQLRKFF